MKLISKFKYQLVLLFLCFLQQQLVAQKVMGDKVLTIGIGLSANLYSGGSSYNYAPNYYEEDFYPNPSVNLFYDYSFADNLSIGLAGSYQNFIYVYTGMLGYDSLGSPIFSERQEEKIDRMNFGTRILYHFGKSEVVDFYTGARLGVTIWEKNSFVDERDYFLFYQSRSNFSFTPQGIFGTRIYFAKNLGLDLEVALGSPYYFMTGLTVKF